MKNPWKKQKKPWFFLVFKNLNQKKQKKTQGKPKKNIFWPETKTSPKSFGFLVFWFSRGFVKILFCWKRRVLLKEEEFWRLYTTFWTYKIDAKKNKHLNIVKKQQNSANTSKFWESMGLGGGGYHIYISTRLHVINLVPVTSLIDGAIPICLADRLWYFHSRREGPVTFPKLLKNTIVNHNLY